MLRRAVVPLALDLTATGGAGGRLSESLIAAMPPLAAARDELLATWQTARGRGLPTAQRLLDDYRPGDGRVVGASQLGRILARARLVADQVDRVVVVAGRDVCLAAQAVLASCTHPFHNELSRAERGGYPRVYFEWGPVDNDALAGLLDLLAPPRASAGLDSRWALISVADGTAETAVKTQVLAQALENSLRGDGDRLEQLWIRLPGPGDQDFNNPIRIGRKITSVFPGPSPCPLPQGERSCGEVIFRSILTPGVLLPAALAGLDVVGLLSGAAATIDRFMHAPPAVCPVLQLAGLGQMAGRTSEACQMTVWSYALEPIAHWYGRIRQQAFAACPPGSHENGSKSATGLHHHRPAEKIGRRTLVLNVVAERLRRDRLTIAGKKLSETMDTTRAAAAAAQEAAGQLVVELRLPCIDECSIGQLLQFLVLATAVEARLALNQNPNPTHA